MGKITKAAKKTTAKKTAKTTSNDRVSGKMSNFCATCFKGVVICVKRFVKRFNKFSGAFVKIITPAKTDRVTSKVVVCTNVCPTLGGANGPETPPCNCFKTNCHGCKCPNCTIKINNRKK
jgi:hypothetical protein